MYVHIWGHTRSHHYPMDYMYTYTLLDIRYNGRCDHMLCTHMCTHVYTSVYTYGDTSEVSTTQWTLCTRTLSTWYEEHHKYIFFAVLVVSFLF